MLLDIEGPDGTVYVLPPPMAGFFEFSMMRVRDDVDQKLLAELFYQYLNVEEDFIKALFTDGRDAARAASSSTSRRCRAETVARTCSTTSARAR